MLNVRKEMALVRPGVQIEDLASFVHVDEGNDVRPAVCVHRADMGGHMPSQELARIRISHLTFPTKHLATQIIVNGSLELFHSYEKPFQLKHSLTTTSSDNMRHYGECRHTGVCRAF